VSVECPHQVLGTKPTDTEDEIRQQYRARVKQTHPDSTDTLDAEAAREQFKEVQTAYENIVDEESVAIGDTGKGEAPTEKQRYTAISLEEFEAFLDEHVKWRRVSGDAHAANEYIYDIPLPRKHLTVRVFSSVDHSTGYTRPCGTDAIRCVIWNYKVGEPVAGRTRTHRIETWQSNLLGKIQSLTKEWKDYDRTCPECDSPLTIREGEYGEFFGCLSYPECQYTEPVEADE